MKGGGLVSPAEEPAAVTESVAAATLLEKINEKFSEAAEAATMKTVEERIDEKVSEPAEVAMMETVVERIDEKVSEAATATKTVVERIDEKVTEVAKAATMKTVVERIDDKVNEAAEVAMVETMVETMVERINEKVSEVAEVTMVETVVERREEEPPGQGRSETVVAEMTATGKGTASMGGSKKKRGRPRKCAPNGNLARPLNPRPLLAPAPVGEYTPAITVGAVMKFGRGRSVVVSDSGEAPAAQYSFHLESAGALYGKIAACSNGANFTSHILTIDSGEDVTMKIISFSQQGPRAICILSANGVISNVTLRRPDSFGGTMTYEGHFQLLSLSGSFIPSETGGTRSRSGGMSVSLARPDGRVIGGGVAGLLIAASRIQVVLGSFLPSYELEQKVKKAKLETALVALPVPTVPNSSTEVEVASCDSLCSPTISKPNLTTSSFRIENWPAPLPSVPDTRNSVLA